MGKFRRLSRTAPRGRSILLNNFLCEAIHKSLRQPKKLVQMILTSALDQLVNLLLEDGIDVTIKGLGRISAEPLDGREFTIRIGDKTVVSEYPPGSTKIKFTAIKDVKSRSRPRFIKRSGSEFKVLEWYDHL